MSRGHVMYLLSVALLVAGQTTVAHSQEEKGSRPPSLYQRIGGYDTLAAVFDNLVPRLATDPDLARFFVGHSTDSNLRQRQRLLELLCQESHGPCRYTGRPLKIAHSGLGIGEAHWTAFQKHLGVTLDHLKLGEKEKGELLALVARYKADIVEKP